MSNLVIVSGTFSSGTTLPFTLFRQAADFCCLYEPLHERVREYLVWPLRAYEGHHFVGDYFSELRRFRAIPDLFDPAWGTSRLHLGPGDTEEGLYRYMTYLVGTGFERSPKVLIKENRLSFRLGWIRANFPAAKILHVWRDCDEQWASIVKRGQRATGRDDVGQGSVHFAGFNLARWCEDLAGVYPELAASRSVDGRDRFGKLWALSKAEHERYSDVSVCLSDLRQDFAPSWMRVADGLGCGFDIDALQRLVVSDAASRPVPQNGPAERAAVLLDRAGRRYARARVQLHDRRRGGRVL